ncbi:MAG: sensor domain-containing diguanylate cyclase [Gammaproteobacteria bacterium]|nr:sensor domain-containing diguanylate cyclase [Gammaproteobacteria bacterium]
MTTQQDKEQSLRQQLSKLTAEAAKNETILRRAQERELSLLQAESLPDLLNRMVHDVADSYGLEAVTVVLCDPEHEVRHLLIGGGSRLDELHGVIFVDALVTITSLYTALKQPWVGPFMNSDHQLIFPGHSNLKSVALLPLMRQQQVIGSMNFGSSDPERFTRQHATDFLNHLAVIASFCLESAVNRARLVRSGMTDVLTGWHNRRYLETRMHEELSRACRSGQTISCVLIDVDHFKQVNDKHGHLIGDQVLREVAARIDRQVRNGDVAARFGGEEFAIVMPNTSVEEAKQLAERVRLITAAAPVTASDNLALAVTLSAGVATIQPKSARDDVDEMAQNLLQQADDALYRAKSAGRNRVVVN